MNDGKPIPLRIKLPYASEQEFVDRYGSNVSRGGIFVATRALKPEGSLLAFEFVLSNGSRLLRGEALVSRAQVDAGGQRAGMTLQFTRLDAPSKALVDRVVAGRSGEHRGIAAHPGPSADARDRLREAESRDPAVQPKQSETSRHGSTPPADGRERSALPPRAPAEVKPEDFALPAAAPKRRRSLPEIPIPSAVATDRGPEVVLGIDLGTTNSRVAVFRNGRPELVPVDPACQSYALPSVVALDRQAGALVVGERARQMLVADPSCAVYAGKRLLGQRARALGAAQRLTRLPYSVVADSSGDAAVRLGDDVHSMTELSAVLLNELKDAAARHLGRPVNRAVMCVPAYFTDHQRSAVVEAARLAGLEVLRIFSEPTSVALAFGYGKSLPRKRILVYDLGGGTFGASVVEVTGDELEVVATGGDNFLGGMDFDERVAAELSSRLQLKAQRADASAVGQEQLRGASERCKIALSEHATCAVQVPNGAVGADGVPVDLRDELSRERLEALTAALVDRTIEVTNSVLASAKLRADQLDEVLVVGGQSKAPLVRQRLQALCGRPVRTDVDAQAAVALGAAILGHALNEAARGKPGVTLSEVLPAPIGIGVRGGGFHRIFERNTRLPAEKTLAFPVRKGQSVAIAVYQGDGAMAEQNDYLGRIEAPADRTGEATLHFALTADGTLNLTAISPAGQREVARISTADAPDPLRAAMLAESPIGDEPQSAASGRLRKGLFKLLGR